MAGDEGHTKLKRSLKGDRIMFKKACYPVLLLVACGAMAQGNDYRNAEYGRLLKGSTGKVSLWWASSGWKISPDKPLPRQTSRDITMRLARNETEAVQVVKQLVAD